MNDPLDKYLPPPPVDLDEPQNIFGAPPGPMPDYVTPRPEVPPVGALSAEAMVRDFEKTAKHIEAMSIEIAGAGQICAEEFSAIAQKYRGLDEYIQEVKKHVNETAESLRDEAKSVFVRIENTMLMTQEMRNLSEQMRHRVAGDPPPVIPETTLPQINLVEQVEQELGKLQPDWKQDQADTSRLPPQVFDR